MHRNARNPTDPTSRTAQNRAAGSWRSTAGTVGRWVRRRCPSSRTVRPVDSKPAHSHSRAHSRHSIGRLHTAERVPTPRREHVLHEGALR
eukprot:6439974-Prymnesium_polylepis.2